MTSLEAAGWGRGAAGIVPPAPENRVRGADRRRPPAARRTPAASAVRITLAEIFAARRETSQGIRLIRLGPAANRGVNAPGSADSGGFNRSSVNSMTMSGSSPDNRSQRSRMPSSRSAIATTRSPTGSAMTRGRGRPANSTASRPHAVAGPMTSSRNPAGNHDGRRSSDSGGDRLLSGRT